MLSFACLAVTLLSMPAHAGHWVLTTTGSGQSTLNGRQEHTYTAPSTTTTNSVSTDYALAASGSSGPGTGTGPPVVYTATSDLTLTVKAVWTADGNSDDTQPPPGIWFSEDTTANGTFSDNGGAQQASTKVDDGFQDPITQSGSSIGTSAKVHYVKSSGDTVTTTLTASVTSKGTSGAAGGAAAVASIGPITISIHAQPYNFHEIKVTNNNDGTLTFYYDWSSTSGNKFDLTDCFIHEYVTYPGPVGTALFPIDYTMPHPFDGSLHNPTTRPGVGASGQPATDREGGMDTQEVPPLSSTSPHIDGNFTGTQIYEFDDIATGETNTQIPGPDSGPFSIKRSVSTPDGILWYYNLTKDGVTGVKPI